MFHKKKVYYKFYILRYLIATGANILELQHHAIIEDECTSLDHTRKSLSFDSEIRLQSCFLMRRECHDFFGGGFGGGLTAYGCFRVMSALSAHEFMHTEPAP